MFIIFRYFQTKNNKSKNRIRKFFTQKKRIFKYENDVCKTVIKIRKIYFNIVKKEFLIVKLLRTRLLKNSRAISMPDIY